MIILMDLHQLGLISIYFREALYNKGFLCIPEKDDITPVACYIYEH